MVVKVKKLVPGAVLPTKAYKGDAGYDLVAVSRTYDAENWCYVYGTGLAFEIPEGYVDRMKAIVRNKVNYCRGALDTDYFRHVFERDESDSGS